MSLIRTSYALIIQVVDDSPTMIRGKTIASVAAEFIEGTSLSLVQAVASQGYISFQAGKRKGGTYVAGGYQVTDKGVRALMEYENTVKRFLDHNTHDKK